MNKRILIVAALAVVVLVGSVVGGVASVYGADRGASYSGQRLFGVVDDGLISMPPDDAQPYFGCFADIIITNPDWQYSKTIQRVVICDGDSGAVVKEIIPIDDEAVLGPQEVWDTDFRMLNVSSGILERHLYTINVYWKGQGAQLIGFIEPAYFEAEQDEAGEWHAVDISSGLSRQMQYYAK